MRTIEEADKSGTDPEDEATLADIPNVTEYKDIFQPNRSCKFIQRVNQYYYSFSVCKMCAL